MKRKLIWLNIVLAGLIAAAAYKVTGEWSAQKKQEEKIRAAKVKPVPVKPVAIPPVPPAVTAATYSDIATKMLFSEERNPTVVVATPAPPPPKPMPPLPFLHGVMGMPDGIVALMSTKASGNSVGVHVGDKIGDFQLASLTADKISFKWEDKTVDKSVSEMIYNTQEQAASAPAAPPVARAANDAPVLPPAPSSSDKAKAGTEVTGGNKTCTPGDTSPAGTVADGYRKVLSPNPFGNSCYWEPVK